MNTSESFRALRRANPRAQDGFGHSVRAVAETVHARIGEVGIDAPSGKRRRVVGLSAAGSLAAAAVVLAMLTLVRRVAAPASRMQPRQSGTPRP